jgi:hypothetical protein
MISPRLGYGLIAETIIVIPEAVVLDHFFVRQLDLDLRGRMRISPMLIGARHV